MSAQRARSAVTADHRSAHPDFPGVPWWGAALIAITATTIGFAFDAGAGSKELSAVFAAAYVIGCLAAVLAVRQTGLFTAVIQPPLILFGSVPTAYFLFHSGQIAGIKDMLINCGYPLIERFPLMFFTSAAVLLVGMARWYYGVLTRRSAPQSGAEETKSSRLTSALTTKLSSLLTRDHADEDNAEEVHEVQAPPRRRRTTDRPDRPTRTAAGTASRGGRPARSASPSRSRHVRPPEAESFNPVAERPRRSRTSRQAEPPPPEPRRRPRRPANPRLPGPPPVDRRAGYERPERPERPERRRRYDDYQPREPHTRNGNGNGTHHPISRVRYRGAEDNDERAEYRSRRRPARDLGADSWEYDV